MKTLRIHGLATIVCAASLCAFTACNENNKGSATKEGDTCTAQDDCGDGFVCTDGACHRQDTSEDAVCGDGVVSGDEACDTAIPAGEPGACPTDPSECASKSKACVLGVIKGAKCTAHCAAGKDEITDLIDGDGCCPGNATAIQDSDCLCGNGTLDANEQCDDGEDNGKPNHCNSDCSGTTEPACGNGAVEPGETCDDGDDNGSPGFCMTDCSAMVPTSCGDRHVDDDEECDDGGQSDTCNADCTAASCGDGKWNTSAGEACDLGDDNGSGLGCTASCDLEDGWTCDETGCYAAQCGDGIVAGDETCDDGADNGTPNHCNNGCSGTTVAICGNGAKETGESCDDGPDNGTPNHCNTQCDGQTGSDCGNGIKEAGEDCDAGGESATCNGNCTAVQCGDGIINTTAGESCDDGLNNGSPNKCSNACDGPTPASCGNGVKEAGESCDDGPDNGQPNKCNSTCDGTTAAVCGNGALEAGEDCDDGGESSTCNANCTAVQCGDGITNTTAGETCDDGSDNGEPKKCNATCDGTTAAVCGNGVKETGEDCDDGGDSASCNQDCTAVQCGDGYVNGAAGETCDDGPDNGQPNKCNTTCNGTANAVCGNGTVEAGEDCDDGGESATCNANCTTVACGDNITNATAGESCDDGADNGQPNKCNTTCDGTTAAVCGNSVVESGEDCDGGGSDTSTCNADCTDVLCGDGYVNTTAGETCDEAGDNGSPNHCNSTCDGQTTPVCGNNAVENGEACDDGGESATCNADCSAASCGDGVLNTTAGETCDDGGDNGSPNHCNATCDGTTAAVCGNGTVESGEDCDGGGSDTSTCNADCSYASCGDGYLNTTAGETCDDGNDNGAPKKCNNTCDGTTAAVCGNGVQESGETCDEGNDNGKPNHCNSTCDGQTAAVCGNNVVESGEDCDSGGSDTGTCNADCTTATCGDGYVNAAAGEDCDDGANNGQPGSSCDASCQTVAQSPDAFRLTGAEIIDPHIYIDTSVIFVGSICQDITNSAIVTWATSVLTDEGYGEGVNGALKKALHDTDSGNYTMSIAFVGDPLDQGNNQSFPASVELPECTENPLTCKRVEQPQAMTTAKSYSSGSCKPTDHGGRNASYTGLDGNGVKNPQGPCFQSNLTTVQLNLDISGSTLGITLTDAQVAAEYDGNPATALKNGMVQGFISAADAANTCMTMDFVGNICLSELLSGTQSGAPSGSCSNHTNDMDTYNGVDGWWLYLNFDEAVKVDSFDKNGF